MDATSWTALAAVTLTLIALVYWRMNRVRGIDHCGWVEVEEEPAASFKGVAGREAEQARRRVGEQVIAHDERTDS